MKLNEYEIARAYVGKTCNKERLSSLFDYNGEDLAASTDENGETTYIGCDMHIAYCSDFEEEVLELFGITEVLHNNWEWNGIDFRVNLFVLHGEVVDCEVFKYREYYSGHGRSSGDMLKPTQQEIRVFRRIMDYITN